MGKYILTAAAIGVAVLAGSGAVYVFNHLPGEWLTDYGEEPDEELLSPTVQRVKSTPWKYLFTAFFILICTYMTWKDPLYALPSTCAAWLLLLMAMADIKYRIIPDQLILLLGATGAGFVPYHARGVMDCALGAGIGLGMLLILALLSKVFYETPGIGGGDIKLFTALGLALGSDGVIIVFILTAFLSAGHFILLLITGRAKPKDKRPMVPYIALSAVIYLVFLHDALFDFVLKL